MSQCGHAHRKRHRRGMAAFEAMIDKDGVLLCETSPKQGSHLSRVSRVATGVSITAHKEDSRVVRVIPNMVIRRVCEDSAKIVRILCRSILAGPGPRSVKEMIADHVKKRSDTNRCTEQIGPLSNGRANEQA